MGHVRATHNPPIPALLTSLCFWIQRAFAFTASVAILSASAVCFAQSDDAQPAPSPTKDAAPSSTTQPADVPPTDSAPADPAPADPAPSAENNVAPAEEYGKVLFEPHIREILAAHCVECHSIKQSKGGFRVDERESLLGYLTPGDVQGSSLWTDYLVTKDEELHMPPLKNGNPLSQFELAAIRVWIEDGAVWPEGVAWTSGQGGEQVVEPLPAVAAEKNIVQKAMTFSGFFHPAIVHFPIGLLLVSGFFVIMAFLKRDAFEAAAFHCLWIGALGAIASCIAGWAYADLQGYADSNDAVMRHRICGIAVAVIAVLLTPIAMAARKSATSRWRYVWAGGALGLALLVSLAGHQGGELHYGEDLVGRAYQKAFGK